MFYLVTTLHSCAHSDVYPVRTLTAVLLLKLCFSVRLHVIILYDLKISVNPYAHTHTYILLLLRVFFFSQHAARQTTMQTILYTHIVHATMSINHICIYCFSTIYFLPFFFLSLFLVLLNEYLTVKPIKCARLVCIIGPYLQYNVCVSKRTQKLLSSRRA
jgi:hypothetical protein